MLHTSEVNEAPRSLLYYEEVQKSSNRMRRASTLLFVYSLSSLKFAKQREILQVTSEDVFMVSV